MDELRYVVFRTDIFTGETEIVCECDSASDAICAALDLEYENENRNLLGYEFYAGVI